VLKVRSATAISKTNSPFAASIKSIICSFVQFFELRCITQKTFVFTITASTDLPLSIFK